MITNKIKRLVPGNVELKLSPNLNKRSQVEKCIVKGRNAELDSILITLIAGPNLI